MKLTILIQLLLIGQFYCNYYFVYNFLNKAIGFSDRLTKILLSPKYETPQIKEDEKFDFIIVGAGSSGSVLANRLSENKSWNILLLEAGEVPNYIFEIPAFASAGHFTQYNWQYKTEKQENFGLGLQDQILEWPRGKGLGGSSLINYMVAVRGNQFDYNHWAELGNPGWSYNDLLPYFKKLENSHILNRDKNYHSQSGNLDISYPPYRTKSVKIFIESAKQTGLNYIDYNGRSQIGVSYPQATLRNGLRCTAEKAYLRPIRKRHNLKILTKSHVTKILIDKNTKKAYGVEYYRKGKYHTVQTTKDVILSAGAFHSPQLLMLSGIGPKQDLTKLGIETIVDLPVGKKLYDHPTFVGLIFEVNHTIVNTPIGIVNPVTILQLLFKRKGPLTKLGAAVEGISYIKTNNENNWSDMELLYLGDSFSTDYGILIKTSFRVSDESYKKYFKPFENKQTFQLFPVLLHPKSYGKVTLKSTNPLDPPLLYGNYLTDKNNEDVKNFLKAIRKIQQITQSDIWQKFGTKQSQIPIPGCEHLKFDSDPYWECGLRHLTATLHHQTSTCKMGPENNTEAVVNNKLQVWGIHNLRIIDLSIVPVTLSGHTSVPATAIAEKASDIIKNDWAIKI